MPIRRRPAGRGAFGSGTSRNGQLLKRRRRPGVPSSWGTLMCLRPALRPRRDRDCQAITAVRHGPTCIQRRGLSTTGNIGARSHGIGARCLRFAVRFTPPHARLASGCPARLYQAGLATRRAPTKGFRDASYIASPFPKLPWRNECPPGSPPANPFSDSWMVQIPPNLIPPILSALSCRPPRSETTPRNEELFVQLPYLGQRSHGQQQPHLGHVRILPRQYTPRRHSPACEQKARRDDWENAY